MSEKRMKGLLQCDAFGIGILAIMEDPHGFCVNVPRVPASMPECSQAIAFQEEGGLNRYCDSRDDPEQR